MNQTRHLPPKNALSVIAAFVAFFLLGMSVVPATATDQADAQAIVDKARVTFDNFMRDKEYTWFHDHLKYVKGLLIYPQVLKAGFIIGGSGGTGILVVRDDDKKDWSEPAFYSIGAVTFGLQIGGEASEVIVMAMSQEAIASLLISSFKFGGDTSFALGPVGAGAKGNITADFIGFSKTKGLYAGLNIEGSVVDVRDSLNRAYYNADVTPADIVMKKKVKNPGSAELRSALAKAMEQASSESKPVNPAPPAENPR